MLHRACACGVALLLNAASYSCPPITPPALAREMPELVAYSWPRIVAPASASEVGEVIFEAKCAACHENGGNVLQRGKTLFPDALAANGYSTQESIAQLLVNGKNQMPKYQGSIPKVSRLTDEEIADVANYVLKRADSGWK